MKDIYNLQGIGFQVAHESDTLHKDVSISNTVLELSTSISFYPRCTQEPFKIDFQDRSRLFPQTSHPSSTGGVTWLSLMNINSRLVYSIYNKNLGQFLVKKSIHFCGMPILAILHKMLRHDPWKLYVTMWLRDGFLGKKLSKNIPGFCPGWWVSVVRALAHELGLQVQV